MPNLNTVKTVKLRKLAEKAKIPKWETLDRKPLIAALNALEPKKEQKEKKTKKAKVVKTKAEKKISESKAADTEDGVIAPGITEERVAVGSKAERMKLKLSKQRKVRVYIQLVGKEKRGSTIGIILNGYRLNVQKGVYVDVPEQVADVIMKSQKQSVAALEHPLRIDDEKRDPQELS